MLEETLECAPRVLVQDRSEAPQRDGQVEGRLHGH